MRCLQREQKAMIHTAISQVNIQPDKKIILDGDHKNRLQQISKGLSKSELQSSCYKQKLTTQSGVSVNVRNSVYACPHLTTLSTPCNVV